MNKQITSCSIGHFKLDLERKKEKINEENKKESIKKIPKLLKIQPSFGASILEISPHPNWENTSRDPIETIFRSLETHKYEFIVLACKICNKKPIVQNTETYFSIYCPNHLTIRANNPFKCVEVWNLKNE